MKVEATDTGHLSPAHLGKIVSLEERHLITESDALQANVSDSGTSRDINCDRIRNTILPLGCCLCPVGTEWLAIAKL